MSADKSAQSIKNLTESHTESDKTQSTASNETSSVTITTVGDDKKGNKTICVNNFFIDSYYIFASRFSLPLSRDSISISYSAWCDFQSWALRL